MIENFLKIIHGIIVIIIETLGYGGIVLCMAIESACIPLPSEIIMPYSGYLAYNNPVKFTLFGISLAGAVGCLLGSIITYYIGLLGGRPLLEKYGKYILITKHDMETSDRFFAKYGDATIFISRLLPVVRTFISLPAGIAKTNVVKFIIYTLLGSFIWCFILGWIGLKIGENWEDSIAPYFHKFNAVIVIVIVLGVAYYIYRHLRK